MKKAIFACLFALLVFGGTGMTTHAQSSHNSNEQALDQLMLDLFHKQIQAAVKNHYKKDSIHIGYDWFNQDYDVVEVDQSEKGHKLKSSYVVKFTIMPATRKSTLGTDTITFGVDPGLFKEKETEIKMLSYDHQKASK